ncbi:MAG: adenylate/guanylate cyclase domain-containing protein [Planctomycetaceae bacterium]|nr:adenylate/guanylate cyclase domain-containing protein [Planctomycetaceae bacterium]
MWQLAVYSRRQHEQFRLVASEISLAYNSHDGRWTPTHNRSTFEADTPSANHMTIRLRPGGEATVIDCRGIDDDVRLADGGSLACRIPMELTLPATFQLGDAWFEIRLETVRPEMLALEPLYRDEVRRPAGAAAQGPDSATVSKWLAAVSDLHRTAASSDAFFTRAAEIAVRSTGLDAAMVLLRDGSGWQIAGSSVADPRYGVSFDPAALDLMVARPDVWRRPASRVGGAHLVPGLDEAASQDSLVVAPVRGEYDEIIAAVYGVRHGHGDNRRLGIRTLEARVIEVLADGVAAGLARRQQEVDAARRRVLLEQAFSPEVAQHLLRQPNALASQTREATMLLADLRGFTRLAETLTASESCGIVSDVMEALTDAITQHGGMVIDYYGDGVSAMWNAPFDQPDHADRACLAALEMLESITRVSDAWRPLLPFPLELGIGIHTGLVQVGNAGTRQRMKYGPRGRAMNLASRVQTAAKRLDVPLLVTDAVRRQASTRLTALRVCTARLPGIEDPVELFTLLPTADAERLQRDLDRYAVALAAYERGDLDEAERELEALLAAGPATPAAFLAQQTAALRRGALGRRADDLLGSSGDAVIEILAN